MPRARCCGDPPLPNRLKAQSKSPLIHRPRYDDWSLPKGKVDPGETAPAAAVREVFEETGHRAVLGRRLVMVSYPIEQGVKKVYYWAARSTGGEFTPGNEVDELVWLPVADAMKKLQYAQDRKVLRRFAENPADTQTVLVVRHGQRAARHATPGTTANGRWTRRDARRPKRWFRSCWPSVSPTCTRPTGCAATRRWNPSPQNWACASEMRRALTEEAYAKNPKRGRHRVLQIARRSGTPVICSQGKVIPDLIAWWCERDGVRPDKARNHKGSAWVLSLAGGRLVAADHIGGALAANVRA